MNANNATGPKKNGIWIRLLILLLFVALTALLFSTGAVKFFLSKEKLIDFLQSLGPLSFLGFVLLQALQVVIAPIPGEVTGLIGGYFFGTFLGVLLSTSGLILGSYIAFALSRAFGRPFVERFIDKALMDRFDYLLHHKGLFLIFMLFLIPGFPKDYLCFILGLGHLSTLEFLAVSSIGRLFGTVILTIGGGFIRYQEYGKLFILAGAVIVAVCIAIAFRDKLELFFHSCHIKHCNKTIPPEESQASNSQRRASL